MPTSSMLQKIDANDYHLKDHANGFDKNLRNGFLDSITQSYSHVKTEYIIDDNIRQIYPHLTFSFDMSFKKSLFAQLSSYQIHPPICYEHFLCSFNGSEHVSRQLLTAILHGRNWFNPATCSKNFTWTLERLDGHLLEYDTNRARLYRKFFINENSQNFFASKISFGYNRFDHAANIINLQDKLTSSFVHLVSETLATSYHPLVTEKFLYSVVTRGLFVAYAPPGWHYHLEHFFGFKMFARIFDYEFDWIHDPLTRLVRLTDMLSKFAILSRSDWYDLYQMESDTIEYNYNHYHSGAWIHALQQHV